MKEQSNILERILERKAEEIAERQTQWTLTELDVAARAQQEPRGFADAIHRSIVIEQSAVIAEVKKASPSGGVIRENFDVAAIASSYAQHGATCISVLTDQDFFQGHNDYLRYAREASGLPVLRKDFVIDPWQVLESRAIGADCVLLIVAALADAQLAELVSVIAECGMDVLVEVHDRGELQRALQVSPRLIGINNRDLRTFKIRLETTLDMVDDIPDGQLLVTESGIRDKDDVRRMQSAGVNAFLVGDVFLRSLDPGAKLSALFSSN